MEEDNKIKSELSSLGLACRGERHVLVMERQREALSELRRRIKELESIKSAIGGKGLYDSSCGSGATALVQHCAVCTHQNPKL